MEAKELNQQLNTDSIDSKDYEVEISSKKGFFSNLLDKLKTNKKQKLLSSGSTEKIHTTRRSISSLWATGNIRASLFKSLDYLHKKISNRISQSNSTATFIPEIISENSKEKDSKILADNSINIIPKVKTQPINHRNSKIDTINSKNTPLAEDLER